MTDEAPMDFGALSEDEKCDNFEVSTVGHILKQLGVPNSTVMRLKSELGPNFGTSWLNEVFSQAYTTTTRFFSYSFEELFTSKKTNPVVTGYVEKYKEFQTEVGDEDLRFFMIFQASGLGRLAASNFDVAGRNNLSIWTPQLESRFYIMPFASVYTDIYGKALDGEELS